MKKLLLIAALGLVVKGGLVYKDMKRKKDEAELNKEYFRIMKMYGIDPERFFNDGDYDIPDDILLKIVKEFKYYNIDIIEIAKNMNMEGK